MSEIAKQTIIRIAQVAEAIGWQAGVGGMETAGQIVSYLASHPEHIEDFVAGRTSCLDWPADWLERGDLTWLAQNGQIVHPETARQARVIKMMEKLP